MAKIYRVIQIKLNQFKKSSIWSLTYQQSVFKRYHSDKHFSEFLPATWRQKSTGIDMERNYAAVTLCILFLALHTRHGQALTLESELVNSVEITSNGHSCWWDANTNQPGTSDKAKNSTRYPREIQGENLNKEHWHVISAGTTAL